MREKKILFLNACIHDVPLILAARNLGFYVVTTSNKPDYIGHLYGDEYIPCDYSDYDALVKLCKKNNISSVSCGTSDGASFPASYLGEYFGWKGHDSLKIIKKLHNKDEFKEFAKTIDLKSPISDCYDNKDIAISSINKYNFPLIVKPNDAAGGQGISVVNSEKEYTEAVNIAYNRSKSKHIVVEPYINGTEHSMTTFIVNRKVRCFSTYEDIRYEGSYMISKGALPSFYDNKHKIDNEIIAEIEKIAENLNLVDGMFHLQYIIKDDKPYIIEVMRRSPGNWDTVLLQETTCINWNEWIIRAEAGLNCDLFPKGHCEQGYYGYYIVLGNKNGIVKDIYIDNIIKNNIVRYNRWEPNGFMINDFEHEKIALVHLKFETKEEMDVKMHNINKYIYIEY